jgi:hypothetical protein
MIASTVRFAAAHVHEHVLRRAGRAVAQGGVEVELAAGGARHVQVQVFRRLQHRGRQQEPRRLRHCAAARGTPPASGRRAAPRRRH